MRNDPMNPQYEGDPRKFTLALTLTANSEAPMTFPLDIGEHHG